MTTSEKLPKRTQRQIRKLVEQATLALSAQRLDIFEPLCTEIENIQPGNADAAHLRALICAQNGNWEEAKVLLKQAIAAEPTRPDLHHDLAKLHAYHKRYDEASEHYRIALRFNPYAREMKLDYCSCLLAMKKAGEALPILEEMNRTLSDPAILEGMAMACIQLERPEEAMDHLERIIARNANFLKAHLEYSLLLMKYGRMDEAEAGFRKVLSLQPDHIKAYSNLVLMEKFTTEDIKAMEVLNERASLDSENRTLLSFALAKAYEDMEQFDKAFSFYKEGNALIHSQSSYDLDASLARLEARASSFTPEVLGRTSNLEDERPIFIVGMPRCGSTLVERILDSHPEVSSRGECTAMEKVFSENRYSDKPLILEDIAAFSPEQWQEIGEAYLQEVDRSSLSKRIIDKTLDNYAMLGAIHCALPQARIVHVRRNPLDNCLAIYRAHLDNRRLDIGSDLNDIGYFYRAYLRVMQHWREVLPEGVMYELDYEQLVANQEEETRKLLTACDLEWNEACLQFNKARTYVKTASVAQVRRPIYTEAVERWKHYEKHLQPLIRILDTGTE